MRFLSVCSGIEAASVAWAPLGWKAAAFAEIEPFPCAVLAHHYPDVPNLGDITRFQEWPDLAVDLVCGGTPCQAFSVAGLRQGLADPRGNLALTFLGIVDRYRPQWVVWENVPGVLSATSHDAPDPVPPPPPLDLGCDGAEVDTEDEYASEELHAFNSFLAGLSELGYGVCSRVLDAQYVRVDGFPRAVPQRRRRVFVVGCLGDWARAAAVLSEPEGVLGDHPPRREARAGAAAGTLGGVGPGGGWRFGADEAAAGQLIPQAFGGNDTRGPIEVSTTLSAHGGPSGRLDFESETFVAEYAPALSASNPYGDHESREGLLVAHTLRGNGFDAGEDGTGRGTPIVPVAFDWYAFQSQSMPVDEICPPLKTTMQPAVAQLPSVRRLTPTECERLMGFPDGYTAVPFRGRSAADGPRYAALGNSWAVNVARWIGRRIELVEAVAAELASHPQAAE